MVTELCVLFVVEVGDGSQEHETANDSFYLSTRYLGRVNNCTVTIKNVVSGHEWSVVDTFPATSSESTRHPEMPESHATLREKQPEWWPTRHELVDGCGGSVDVRTPEWSHSREMRAIFIDHRLQSS